MAISDLISKIKEDTHKEAQEILNRASREEREIIQKQQALANRERANILEKADREAKSRADRILSSTELKVRNDLLLAKQSLIDKVFAQALVKLENLKPEELQEFIKKSILECPFEGEVELVLAVDYKEQIQQAFIDEINELLKKMGKGLSVIMSTQVSNNPGQIVLSQKGIEMNFTFKAIIASLKEEMEFEITKILFQ